MSGTNIVWDVSDIRGELPHKDLIQTFVEKYLVEQKQISLKPNPFLLKYRIVAGECLPSQKIDNLPFEKISLYAESYAPFTAPVGFSRLYDVSLRGLPRAHEGLGNNEITIGEINMYQVFSDESLRELKKESVCFVPVKNDKHFAYRDMNSTRRVHLIFDPDLNYSDAEPLANFFPDDRQVFIRETGNILLVKKRV